MTNEELKQKITEAIPNAEFSEEGSEYLNVIVNAQDLRNTAKFLKDNNELSFDFMFCLTGVDWITHLMVIYHFASIKFDHKIELKVKITDRENPLVDTLSDLWQTANFHEREVYDLFGIKFKGHPDMRRIFLDDDWVGFPLRKDYKDEANIVEL